MMRRLIRADGTTIDLPDPVPVKHIDQMIGCTMTDHVTLWHLGDNPVHVMFCDDYGYETVPVEHEWGVELRCTKARKPVNVEATKLYHANCKPGTTHQIVGDVLVVPDTDYADAEP